ncbi:MAG: hypothetical protein K2X82_09660 [Gemmataceae bacterium]|nr:hypothetical protein [Gemmataceae bacterium]
MNAHVLFITCCVVLAGGSFARSQDRPPSSENIARDYNTKAQGIQDQVDSLYKKLDNPNLSMSDAAAIIDKQSGLRLQADATWAESQKAIDQSFSYKRQEINDYNRANQELDFQSAIAGSQIGLVNNVAKYPEKAMFEANKEAMSKEWEQTYGSRLKPFGEEWAAKKEEMFKSLKENNGIDLAKDGYGRIGTYNPYTGETYYKYYDKDGNLLKFQWQNDAKGWEKWQEDSRTYWRRQRQQQDQLQRDAAQLMKDNGTLNSTQKALSGGMTKFENAAKRVNFAGNWNGGDNVGNTVRLTLGRGGSMSYYFGGTDRPTTYDGTWTQTGRQITAQTSDGAWTLKSTINDQFRLEFNAIRNSDGKTFYDSLRR